MISIFIKAPKLRGIKLRQKPVSLINFQHGNRTRDRVGERVGRGSWKNTFSYALANGLCASSDIQLLENAAVNEKLSFNKAFPSQYSSLFSAASSTSPPCPATEPGSGLAFVAGEGEVKSSTVRQSRLFCPSSSVVLCRCSDDSAFGIQFIVKQHLSVSIAGRWEQRREGRAQGDKAKPFLKPVEEGEVGAEYY